MNYIKKKKKNTYTYNYSSYLEINKLLAIYYLLKTIILCVEVYWNFSFFQEDIWNKMWCHWIFISFVYSFISQADTRILKKNFFTSTLFK